MFLSFLGINSDDADELLDILLKAVKEYNAELSLKDEYGQRYQLDFNLEWKGRHAIIRTAWIIEPDIPYPRLTSCYVLGKQ